MTNNHRTPATITDFPRAAHFRSSSPPFPFINISNEQDKLQPRLPPSQKLGVIRVFFVFMKIDTNFRQLQSVIFYVRENDNVGVLLNQSEAGERE
jgi:hypothetical protein